MLKVICDRCGDEIPADGRIGLLEWNFRERLGGMLADENAFYGQHFCEGCMAEIKGFIMGKPVAAATEENPGSKGEEPDSDGWVPAPDNPEPDRIFDGSPAGQDADPATEGSPEGAELAEGQQSGGKKPRKRIDKGKVLALAKAGRSAAWIADDMGITKAAVYGVLRRLREQGGDTDAGQGGG